MPIRDFEYFHGAVLTKITRSKRRPRLALIETDSKNSWATYRLNDAVEILVKVSKKSVVYGKSRKWKFGFQKSHLRQLARPDTWLALVCIDGKVGEGFAEICLLDPRQISRLVSQDSERPQWVQAELPSGKQWRVTSAESSYKRLVPRSRLDKWSVPGG